MKFKNNIIHFNISNLPFLKNFLFLFPLRLNNFCEIRIYQREKNKTTLFPEDRKNTNSAQLVNQFLYFLSFIEYKSHLS